MTVPNHDLRGEYRAPKGASMLTQLSTRRCHGCADSSVHTHHLTWIGRLRFTTWLRPWLRK